MRSRVPVRTKAVPPVTKHSATFARRERRIIEVMKNHRHENQVNRIVGGESIRHDQARIESCHATVCFVPVPTSSSKGQCR